SGTLTVVVTETNWKVGSCTVVPLRIMFSASDSPSLLPSSSSSLELLDLLVDVVPSNVNSSTSPISLKKGTTVSRTYRRSSETTAWIVRSVPSERTTITGCCAAANSPTTGITLITKGVCDVSETKAC